MNTGFSKLVVIVLDRKLNKFTRDKAESLFWLKLPVLIRRHRDNRSYVSAGESASVQIATSDEPIVPVNRTATEITMFRATPVGLIKRTGIAHVLERASSSIINSSLRFFFFHFSSI